MQISFEKNSFSDSRMHLGTCQKTILLSDNKLVSSLQLEQHSSAEGSSSSFWSYLASPFLKLWEWIQSLFCCKKSEQTQESSSTSQEMKNKELEELKTLSDQLKYSLRLPTVKNLHELMIQEQTALTNAASDEKDFVTKKYTQQKQILENLLKLENEPPFQYFCNFQLEDTQNRLAFVLESSDTTKEVKNLFSEKFNQLRTVFTQISTQIIAFPVTQPDVLLQNMKGFKKDHADPFLENIRHFLDDPNFSYFFNI